MLDTRRGAEITPQQAREYIEVYRTHTQPGATHLRTTTGPLYFDQLSDDDAVKVARALSQMEAAASMMALKKAGLNG